MEEHNAVVNIEADRNETKFFIVSSKKLGCLYVLTFGLYAVYWFYKNWKYQQKNIGRKISPPWRSIFYYFFTHSLFRKISNSVELKNLKYSSDKYRFNSGILATTFVSLMLLSNISLNLSDKAAFAEYYNVLTFLGMGLMVLSALPLQGAQDAVNYLSEDPLGTGNASYNWLNIVCMILGGVAWLALIFGLVVNTTLSLA